jgi:outer membrane protein OmpA-like peptidoglycan-associated protein
VKRVVADTTPDDHQWMRNRSLPFRSAFACLVVVAGCSKQASISTTPPPVEEPLPAEPAVAEVEEPEAEPVVAEEPKNLEIQNNVIRLKPGIRILFATNSDKLLDPSFPILDEVASVMAQNERLRIRVEGHTDSDGKPAHNQDLSTRRAASVRSYIVTKGVAEERLESTGCGQNVPIADNASDDGKQQNRRVEFVILRKRRQVEPCQLYRPRGERRRGAAEEPATP